APIFLAVNAGKRCWYRSCMPRGELIPGDQHKAVSIRSIRYFTNEGAELFRKTALPPAGVIETPWFLRLNGGDGKIKWHSPPGSSDWLATFVHSYSTIPL